MKLKQILALLLVIILSFSLVSCTKDKSDKSNKKDSSYSEALEDFDDDDDKDKDNDKADKDDDNKNDEISPLLYKVSDDDGNVVWLFGSIHVGRKDFYPLPDYVLDAFDNSDALAVEADIISFEDDITAQTKVLAYFKYSDGTKIDDHIPKDLYEDAVELLKEYDFYNKFYDYYTPIFWYSLIESLQFEEIGADFDLGIDRHLMERALDNDKEILEVESVDFQYQMLADYSEELQIILLEEIVDSNDDIDSLKDELDEMLDLWASGNEKKFSKYLENDTNDLTDEELDLFNEYNDAMIVNRNLGMADYAEEALLSGNEIFICVGAAHVVGDGAMAQLLEERGYNVELVKN